MPTRDPESSLQRSKPFLLFLSPSLWATDSSPISEADSPQGLPVRAQRSLFQVPGACPFGHSACSIPGIIEPHGESFLIWRGIPCDWVDGENRRTTSALISVLKRGK